MFYGESIRRFRDFALAQDRQMTNLVYGRVKLIDNDFAKY